MDSVCSRSTSLYDSTNSQDGEEKPQKYRRLLDQNFVGQPSCSEASWTFKNRDVQEFFSDMPSRIDQLIELLKEIDFTFENEEGELLTISDEQFAPLMDKLSLLKTKYETFCVGVQVFVTLESVSGGDFEKSENDSDDPKKCQNCFNEHFAIFLNNLRAHVTTGLAESAPGAQPSDKEILSRFKGLANGNKLPSCKRKPTAKELAVFSFLENIMTAKLSPQLKNGFPKF